MKLGDCLVDGKGDCTKGPNPLRRIEIGYGGDHPGGCCAAVRGTIMTQRTCGPLLATGTIPATGTTTTGFGACGCPSAAFGFPRSSAFKDAGVRFLNESHPSVSWPGQQWHGQKQLGSPAPSRPSGSKRVGSPTTVPWQRFGR